MRRPGQKFIILPLRDYIREDDVSMGVVNAQLWFSIGEAELRNHLSPM
jgi:hypothetical protein